MVLLFSFSSAEGEFRAGGVVEHVEGSRILLHVQADDCTGHYEFHFGDPSVLKQLSKGQTVFFRATGNPCVEGDVQLLEIRLEVFGEAEYVEVGD